MMKNLGHDMCSVRRHSVFARNDMCKDSIYMEFKLIIFIMNFQKKIVTYHEFHIKKRFLIEKRIVIFIQTRK